MAAASDLANPVGGVSTHTGNDSGGEGARQQLQELRVTALHRILCPAVPNTEFIGAQVGYEVNRSRHAPLCTALWR
jgi:hypothetical protein